MYLSLMPGLWNAAATMGRAPPLPFTVFGVLDQLHRPTLNTMASWRYLLCQRLDRGLPAAFFCFQSLRSFVQVTLPAGRPTPVTLSNATHEMEPSALLLTSTPTILSPLLFRRWIYVEGAAVRHKKRKQPRLCPLLALHFPDSCQNNDPRPRWRARPSC